MKGDDNPGEILVPDRRAGGLDCAGWRRIVDQVVHEVHKNRFSAHLEWASQAGEQMRSLFRQGGDPGSIAPSGLGYAFVIAQALVVAAFAALQYLGLRRSMLAVAS